MLINHIFWKPKTIDYSAKLAQCKAEMGAMYKMHPDHDPLKYPWQYDEWQLKLIEAARRSTQH